MLHGLVQFVRFSVDRTGSSFIELEVQQCAKRLSGCFNASSPIDPACTFPPCPGP